MERNKDGKFGFGQFAYYDRPNNFGQFIQMTFSETISMASTIGKAFVGIFTGSTKTDQLGGPIAIIASGNTVAKYGPIVFINYIAFISINFFILNLIPVPPFDGSKIVFGVYEGVAKKEPNRKFVNTISVACVLLLLGFFLILSIQDIGNLFK